MPVPQTWTDLSETPSANSPGGSETVGPYANDYFQAAYAFIRQLYDGAATPNQNPNANNNKIINVAPGTALTDAVNVNQLNTVLGAPSGTRAVFQQATAPTGWTVDANTALTDCAMRFNQAVSNGGSATWSSWNFGGSFTTGAHAITPSEMPSHSHGDAGHSHGVGDPGHGHGVSDNGHAHSFQVVAQNTDSNGSGAITGGTNNIGNDGVFNGTTSVNGCGIGIAASGCGISIGTGYANLAAAGGNAGHTHTFTSPQVKYADCVVCIKS